MSDYADFLERKRQLGGDDGFAPDPATLPAAMLPFQRFLTTWALRKGRAAIYSDCGTGKGLMALAWADQVLRKTGRPVLIVAPLAVTFQTEHEAAKFGIEAATSRDGKPAAGITVTNYDRLHLFDPNDWAGLVCDESSAIKGMDTQRRSLVTTFSRKLRYRLLATATAAPNDYVELGTSSEALGHLGQADMLSRFFVNDQHSSHPNRKWAGGDAWRFKGHAEEPFWRWVASWARAMRKPSDIGFADDGFDLPPLVVNQHVVKAHKIRPGMLFEVAAVGMREEREELRRTVEERCEHAADLLADAESAVAWCNLNDESAALARLIPGAVEVRGSDTLEAKEQALRAFAGGDVRVLVSKASVCGHGLNWQHCHRATFFPEHSFERWYQAVRRMWRFGQTEPVTVDVVSTEGTSGILANLQRKADQADRMFASLIAHMADAIEIDRSRVYDQPVAIPAWLQPTEKAKCA